MTHIIIKKDDLTECGENERSASHMSLAGGSFGGFDFFGFILTRLAFALLVARLCQSALPKRE